jgi:uncharacterized membrane protein
MGPYALALVAAVVHAGWNLLLARSSAGRDRPAVTAPLLCSVVVLAPFAIAVWRVSAAAIPWAIGSAVAELVYFWFLDRLYRELPVERSYPVSRGVAPVLVLLAGVALSALGVSGLSAWPGTVPVLGVLTLCTGVVLTSRAGSHGLRRLLALTLPVSVGIAVYTVLDSRGVQHASPPSYLLLVSTPMALVLVGATVRAEGWRPTLAAYRSPRAWLGGAGITAAYLLVLFALARSRPSQVPVVAGLRETSVVLVPLFGWLVTRRRPPGVVLLGSALILVALLLVRL